jgi:hypothetical protein
MVTEHRLTGPRARLQVVRTAHYNEIFGLQSEVSAFGYLRGEPMNKGVRDRVSGAPRLALLLKRVHLSSSVREG